jgi:hypothetical protein
MSKVTNAINWSAIKQQAADRTLNPTLMLLLCGPQGGGKSFTAGTLGVPTLYLYGDEEVHGPDQASIKGGGNITPVSWSKGTPDQSYQFLLDVLNSDVKSEFGAVVIDSSKDLISLIRSTEIFLSRCRTKDGGHNSWGEGTVILDLLRPIMKRLTQLHQSHVHVVMTMILEVEQMGIDGDIALGKPTLPTYGITTALCPQFPDIAVVSYVARHDDGPGHYLQFNTNVRKQSKEQDGRVKATLNLTPRITPASADELPAYGSSDLSKLAAFKAGIVAKRMKAKG